VLQLDYSSRPDLLPSDVLDEDLREYRTINHWNGVYGEQFTTPGVQQSALSRLTVTGQGGLRADLRIAPIAADLRFGSVRVQGRACSIAERRRRRP